MNDELKNMTIEASKLIERIMITLTDDVNDDVPDDVPTSKESNNELEEPTKLYLSWEDIQEPINNSVDVIKDDYDVILCITRGGLIPAGMLSYALNIKTIVNVNISSYNTNDKLDISSVRKMSKRDLKKLRKAKKVLIVDDIIDSGSTLIALDSYLRSVGLDTSYEKYSTFAIVTKKPDLSTYAVYDMSNQFEWVVFPWDSDK